MLDNRIKMCYNTDTIKKGSKEMNKNSWYYENARTGEITDIKEAANWWAECGDDVNYWRWSNFSQEWEIAMVREGY